MSCGAIPAMLMYDRAPILSVHFLLGVLIFEAPPEITLVIAHLSVWVSVGLSRRLIASEVENEEGIDRTRWLLHVHIEFLVASNTSEQHEPLHYSVQFRAFIVVCMHSTADVCRFIETAHYRQKVSVMIFSK